MNKLTIKELQEYLSLKYKGKTTQTSLFMKLVEETGEVAEVLNKLEGRKTVDDNLSLADELVDAIHYLVAIAAINDIDLTTALLEKDKRASLKYNQTPNLSEFIATED